jgi:hypothetical protein
MDHHDYLAWLSEIDDLSSYQLIATVRLLAGQPSLGLLEEQIGTGTKLSALCGGRGCDPRPL